MSKRYLLPSQGNFYKANLHAHSTLSDGRLDLWQLKELYARRGYRIMAFTDHRHLDWHSELDDPDFLALCACEVDLNEVGEDWPRTRTYHLNLYDTRPGEDLEKKRARILPRMPYGDIAALNSYIAEMNALGFLVCYNHPYWSLQTYEDYAGLTGLFAMEIYNHGCEGDGLYGGNPQVYDEMLRAGQRLYCLATDDNHNSYPPEHPLSDSFGGYTVVIAPQLTYASVVRALRSGHFYSSTGPQLRALFLQGNRLVVRCSPVEKIYVVSAGRDCHKALAPQGQTLEEAEFDLNGTEGYIRVDCRDARGRHAYSNAYFL